MGNESNGEIKNFAGNIYSPTLPKGSLSFKEEDHYLEDVEEEIIQNDPRLLEGRIEDPSMLKIIDLYRIKEKYSKIKNISQVNEFRPIIDKTKKGIGTLTIMSIDHRSLRYYSKNSNESCNYVNARIIKGM